MTQYCVILHIKKAQLLVVTLQDGDLVGRYRLLDMKWKHKWSHSLVPGIMKFSVIITNHLSQ